MTLVHVVVSWEEAAAVPPPKPQISLLNNNYGTDWDIIVFEF